MAEFDARRFERIAGLDTRHRRIVRPAADVAAKRLAALRSGDAQLVGSPMSPGTPVVCLDRAGRCTSPWVIDLVGEGHFRETQEGVWVASCEMSILVPCRGCDQCARAKQWRWGTWAVREWRAAERTWFLTLTYKPEVWNRRMYEAERRFGKGFADLPEDERRSLYVAECGRDLRLFTVALRNYALSRHARRFSVGRRGLRGSAGLRQFAVAEFTKNGVVHWHMLLHETDPDFDVVKDAIELLWISYGQAHPRLVRDEKQCRYVAKYLGKGNTGRVRASPSYGRMGENDLPDVVPPVLKF